MLIRPFLETHSFNLAEPRRNTIIKISNPAAVAELVEALAVPGAATMTVDGSDADAQPVRVFSYQAEESVVLDVSAFVGVVAGVEVEEGQGVRLFGQSGGARVRTPVLAVTGWQELDGQVLCSCEYPSSLELLQPRDDYRATLRLGMEVGVLLRKPGRSGARQGDLRDLSMGGCLVELEPNAASVLEEDGELVELEFCFPNQSRFAIDAHLRHKEFDAARNLLRAGFLFAPCDSEQDRQLWYFVREAEREAARTVGFDSAFLHPSPLFHPAAGEPQPVGRRQSRNTVTGLARRLSQVAGYLDGQILEMQQGGAIDAAGLSRNADRLLALQVEDREGLLFNVACLPEEPALVCHTLAVAVRLTDMCRGYRMPGHVLKAVAASALVHDLGKALLAAATEGDGDAAQPAHDQDHVTLIMARLEPCHWLSVTVVQNVIRDINERLDGSGYPGGRTGADLHELARLAGIVDTVDALGRPGPCHAAQPVDAVHRHLLQALHQYDETWVARYFEHFGDHPVGTALRYPGGVTALVRNLDSQGRPGRVVLLDGSSVPGEIVEGPALERLGEPVALAAPDPV